MERNTKMSKSSPGKSCFTLIELLIVVAIIAILAGLLMPALQSALGKAREVSCMNNLMTIGKQFVLYHDAYNDYDPPIGSSTVNEYAAWYDFLWWMNNPNGNPFPKQKLALAKKDNVWGLTGIYACPVQTVWGGKHYARNWYLFGGNGISGLGGGKYSIKHIRRPSQRMHIGEIDIDATDGVSYLKPANLGFRHGSGMMQNCLMLDGHTEKIRRGSQKATTYGYFWGKDISD